MKSRYLTFATLALVGGAALTLAQGPGAPQLRMDRFYLQKELRAPETIKTSLASLRKTIAEQNLSFTVGYTDAMDVPLENLAATKAPDNLRVAAAEQESASIQMDRKLNLEYQRLRIDPSTIGRLRFAPSPSLKRVDWRTYGKVTPVRNQSACGSCWAFGAMGALEGSWAKINNAMIDTSEQQVLSCSGAGDCSGGWHAGVFNWTISNGVAKESTIPYAHVNGSPSQKTEWCTNTPGFYKAANWGYVASGGGVPSVEQMKKALCDHGPLVVAVKATSAFQAYTGGVFGEGTMNTINHDVTLIGWDDNKGAWIIKNSWGTNWGETCDYGSSRGYMYIKYGNNNIGYGAAWVDAVKEGIRFNPDIFKDIRILPNGIRFRGGL